MSGSTVLLIVFLFIIKHFIIDFPLQGEFQWKNKGKYGHLGGILHALLHTIGTFLILMFFINDNKAILLALADGLIHYHIDWLKMNINQYYNWKPSENEEFWWLLGLDQFMHYLTYVVIISIIL